MHEGPRELNQALIKGIVRSFSHCQPKFLQHIMRFVIEAMIEALEITEVMGVVFPALVTFNQGFDRCTLFAHLGIELPPSANRYSVALRFCSRSWMETVLIFTNSRMPSRPNSRP